MGLVANVPYALAPGMGLNAFFTFTVVMQLGFAWQEALAMVFICGLINVLITVTKVRKLIVKSIPESLQNAIGGGIGVFIAYIGFLNVGLIDFAAGVPEIVTLNNPTVLLTIFGLILTVILLILNVKGAIFIGIIITTLVGVPFGLTQLGDTISFGEALSQLPETFLAAFGNPGLVSLFNNPAKLPLVLMTIFAFSLADTFDTIGTFIGTGRRSGIFTDKDVKALEESSGFSSKMDKALFADSIGTSIGAIFGTSNTTTFVESAAGIGAGGKTGLTSVVVAILLILSAFFAPVISAIPSAATSPALIIVGIMMLSAFRDINWSHLDEAIPAFFAGIFMGLCYSISYGIATGFIFYCIVKLVKREARDINPVLWVSTILFILNFVVLAFLDK